MKLNQKTLSTSQPFVRMFWRMNEREFKNANISFRGIPGQEITIFVSGIPLAILENRRGKKVLSITRPPEQQKAAKIILTNLLKPAKIVLSGGKYEEEPWLVKKDQGKAREVPRNDWLEVGRFE